MSGSSNLFILLGSHVLPDEILWYWINVKSFLADTQILINTRIVRSVRTNFFKGRNYIEKAE